jgi:hypothetical protein
MGEFAEDKKNGKGRFLEKDKPSQIYEGDFSNDKKNGDGMVINRNGEVISSEFRNDLMEGRRKTERVLKKEEVDKYFNLAFKHSEHFIEVSKGQMGLKLTN